MVFYFPTCQLERQSDWTKEVGNDHPGPAFVSKPITKIIGKPHITHLYTQRIFVKGGVLWMVAKATDIPMPLKTSDSISHSLLT